MVLESGSLATLSINVIFYHFLLRVVFDVEALQLDKLLEAKLAKSNALA